MLKSRLRWFIPSFVVLMLIPSVGVPAAQETAASRVEYHTFFSKVLNKEKTYGIYLPPGYDASKQRYPILYFLHGLFNTERQWEEKGGKVVLDQLITDGKIPPLVVAIPDGDNSFYVDSVDSTARYEAYMVEEFIPMVESTYRVKADKEHRGITGLSMGGFGALTLAMRHPSLFVTATAHSAVLIPVPFDQLPQRLRDSYASQLFAAAFGSPVNEGYWRERHPIDLVATAKNLKTVAWYFDCGTEDRYGFNKGAERFDAVLTAAGVPHEFHLYPGNHGWEYALTHFPESLAFFVSHLR